MVPQGQESALVFGMQEQPFAVMTSRGWRCCTDGDDDEERGAISTGRRPDLHSRPILRPCADPSGHGILRAAQLPHHCTRTPNYRYIIMFADMIALA